MTAPSGRFYGSLRIVAVEVGDDVLDRQAGAGDALAAEGDEVAGPLDLLGQGVDVEAVVVQLVEDGLELGQGLGVAGLVRWVWSCGSSGVSARLASVALGEGGDQHGAGGCVGGGADEVAGGGPGDGPPPGEGAGGVVGVEPGVPLDEPLVGPVQGAGGAAPDLGGQVAVALVGAVEAPATGDHGPAGGPVDPGVGPVEVGQGPVGDGGPRVVEGAQPAVDPVDQPGGARGRAS